MFTSFSTVVMERQSIAEKLHLVKRRRFVSHCVEYQSDNFYTTVLYTYSKDNKKAIEKFINRSPVPVISDDSEEVQRYKYLVTVNTIFNAFGNKIPQIAVYDPEGKLVYLLSKLLSKCKSVYIITKNTAAYETENNRLYVLIGASAVVTESPTVIMRADAIICTERLTAVGGIPIFGQGGFFAHNDDFCLPKNLGISIDKDVQPLCVAAGLYYSVDKKGFENLCCNSLKQNGNLLTKRQLANMVGNK